MSCFSVLDKVRAGGEGYAPAKEAFRTLSKKEDSYAVNM